jgi:protein phosphatase PTC1
MYSLNFEQLWDVTTDQAAINLIRDIDDAQAASHKLLSHALDSHTTDNVTVLVVRFKNDSEGSSDAGA